MSEWMKGQNRLVLAVSAILTVALIAEAASISLPLGGAFVVLAGVWVLMLRRSTRRRRS